MTNHSPWLTLAAGVFVAGLSFADVRDTPGELVLSLSAGAPALVVRRADWVIDRERRRPDGTAVYYMLTSDRTEMVLSAYIDKSTTCQSADSCLQEALKNPSYKDARDQKVFQSGVFRAAQFYLDRPDGAPIKQAHILAAAYVDGHWFDLHISKTGAERPEMAPLLELLKSLSIR